MIARRYRIVPLFSGMLSDMIRKASAHWTGDLKAGQGTVSTESGVLSGVAYSFGKRFEDEKGTNPEELLASAHAACFTMQLSALIAAHGHEIKALDTEAHCEFEKVEAGFAITRITLVVKGDVTNASPEDFEAHVKEAAAICPISKALSVPIDYKAELI